MTQAQLTPQELEAVLAAVRVKASGSNPGIGPTGPGGLFNIPGTNPNITSTYIPPTGIEGFLEQAGHVRTSMYTNPVFGIITGQTASTGTEPTSGCDENVPTAGNLKMCYQSWPFGEFTLKSQPIQVDKSGQLINSGSPVGLQLINNPFATDVANAIVPQSPEELFRSIVAKLTVELANDFTRRYAAQVWTGNPVNTAGNTGGYVEFYGLNKIVNTGYKDVNTGIACAAADSLVMDFGGDIAQNNVAKIVRWFVEATRDRLYLASRLNFGRVDFAWVMRYQAFLSLTDIWPCAYYTFRCYTAAPAGSSATGFVDAGAQVAMRDDMRAGRYLLIDGMQIPVIIDETMEELNVGNGNFQSDAYLLPLSAPGKFSDTNGQLTYMEYFNYRGPFGMSSALGDIAPDQIYKTSGDGRFAMVLMAPTGFCRQIMMRTSKRIVVRTPFLAARIDNIAYNVYQHERSWEPGTSFFVNGGGTSFAGQTFGAPVAA
jgi:hypothetical protein